MASDDLVVGPGRYVQAPGALADVGRLARPFGTRALLVTDAVVDQRLGGPLADVCGGAGITLVPARHEGPPTEAAAADLARRVREAEADFVLAAGGGRVIDAAKVAAVAAGRSLVTVASSSATCAAASGLAVLYEPDGRHRESRRLPAPALCIVDPAVIAAAPVRLFAAGMADALAKRVEGRAAAHPEGTTLATRMALALCEEVADTILALGVAAARDVASGRCTEAVEEVVRASVLGAALIGGLGGRRVRSAGGHALYYAVTHLGAEARRESPPPSGEPLHGELVGFGLLFQSRLLSAPASEVSSLAGFLARIGLPLTLAGLGLGDLDRRGRGRLAALVLRAGSPISNLPIRATEGEVLAALDAADAAGKQAERELAAGRSYQ
jgi:glycerol dehydrogenase